MKVLTGDSWFSLISSVTLRPSMTFRLNFFFIAILFACSSFLTKGSIADSDDVSVDRPNWDQKKYLLNSLRLYISPKGQTYFNDNLQDFLTRNGVILDRGIIDAPQVFNEKLPFSLAKLPNELAQYQKTVNQVIDLFKRFVSYIPTGPRPPESVIVQDPLFSGSVQKVQYRAGFSRLGVFLNPDGTLKLEAKVHGLISEALGLRVVEKANPSLAVGIASPKVSFHLNPRANTSGELTLDSLLDVKINERGEAEVNVQKPNVNAEGLEPFLSLSSPLKLPKLDFTLTDIDGTVHSHSVSSQEIEVELLKLIPSLGKNIYTAAIEQIGSLLPKELEKQLEALLDSAKDSVTTIEPPGGPSPAPVADHFLWNVIPQKIAADRSNLRIDLKTISEDPKKGYPNLPYYIKPTSTPLSSAEYADIAKNDVTIELHQNFFNRLLHLSFMRGYFDEISVGDDPADSFRILEPPVVKIAGAYGQNRVRLGLYVEQDVSGFINHLFVRDPIRLRFDGWVRLVPSKKGGIQIIFESIDLESMVVDRDRIKAFPEKVKKSVRAELAAVNKGLALKPEILAENITLPESLFGIPLKLKSFKSGRLGSIFIFVEYGL
jgi:hypothetical protein